MRRTISVILLALALTAIASPGVAQYRPAEHWQDLDRQKYATCYAEHDARMARYDDQIGYERQLLEDNEIAIRAARDPRVIEELVTERTRIRISIRQMEQQRPTVENRSYLLRLKCQRRVDLAAKSTRRTSTVIQGSGSTRYVTRTTRGTGTRYVTTGRGSGSRYVSMGRGVGSRAVTQGVRGTGGRVVVPTSRGIGSRGSGSRGIGNRGIGNRGIGSRCHHQPATSQRHCGSG
jgi:hypothetical protein